MKISLVVIAKNEAEKISACIGSAADLVDEVLVVDSGSTDGTQALAELVMPRIRSGIFPLMDILNKKMRRRRKPKMNGSCRWMPTSNWTKGLGRKCSA